MIRLHERTQRRICRVVFVVGCFAPLVGVALWAVSTYLPSQRQALAERIERELGLAVEIERASFPRPGEFTCGGITLRSRSGGPPLATIDQIDAAPLRDSEGTVWRLAGVQTAAGSLQEVASTLWHATGSGGAAYVFIDHWTITPPKQEPIGRPLHITSFHLRSVPNPDGGNAGRQIRVQFRQTNASEDVAIRLETSLAPANGDPPTLVYEFNTGDATLPCWALGSWLPAATSFGRATRFTGKGKITMQSRGTDVELNGKLIDVDFDHAMESLAAGTAHASGTVTLDSLRVHNGGLESARGAVACNSGAIDRQLVDAAVRALYCVRTGRSHPLDEPDSSPAELSQVRFDELAFRFSIDAAGMTLWGACESAEQGTMIARGGWSLLSEPRYRVLPVANLVYLVVPQAPHYVPATREAQAIAKRLPFPSIVPDENVHQAAHIGAGESEEGDGQ